MKGLELETGQANSDHKAGEDIPPTNACGCVNGKRVFHLVCEENDLLVLFTYITRPKELTYNTGKL